MAILDNNTMVVLINLAAQYIVHRSIAIKNASLHIFYSCAWINLSSISQCSLSWDARSPLHKMNDLLIVGIKDALEGNLLANTLCRNGSEA